MAYEFEGTVTQKSNGQIVITPKQDSKRLPAMGDEVSITVEVKAGVKSIEARHTPAETTADGAAPAVATGRKRP